MSKLFKMKLDGSLEFSVENKLLENIRKIHIWYTSKVYSWIALVILSGIDVAGFLNIAQKTINDSQANRTIIISAFVVAFEIAPLYIGYVLCLKSYGLWKSHGKFDLGKFVLVLSVVAFVLGVISNSVYRILTINVAYPPASKDATIAVPMTIIMIILPIITSFVNIIIACLSFDPLLFELLRLTKKLNELKIKRRQLISDLEELSDDDTQKKNCMEIEERYYINAKTEIRAIRLRLINFIVAQAGLDYIDSSK